MKKIISTVLALTALFFSTSCDNALNGKNPPVFCRMKSVEGGIIDLHSTEVTRKASITFNYAPDRSGELRIEYDPQYLEAYNAEHGTSFLPFPEDRFQLGNGGVVSVSHEGGKRYGLDISISPLGIEAYEPEQTYAIPLKLTTESKGIKVAEQNTHLVYWVRNLAHQEEIVRKPGEKKVFCYINGGQNNPLNLLQWISEDGRPLVDVAVIFAYNINYNRETGKVYIHSNESCQFFLDNADKIIKPLRDKGIKVLLGILGNHTPAGLAQLSPLGCKDFAAQVADMCRTYHFDGVNYDDEYSTEPDLNNPLMCPPSSKAASRLCLETKLAMPDKLVTIFQWGNLYGEDEVDNHEAGDFIDIAVGNYGTKGIAKKGMSDARVSIASVEMAQGNRISVSQAQQWASTDYGYVMLFGTWGNRNTGSSDHFTSLDNLSKGLYGTALKTPEFYYPSSTSFNTRPYPAN